MKLKNIGICALLVLALVGVIIGQAHYEEASVSRVATKLVTVKQDQIAAYFLYEESGCGKTYGFSEDRFEYEVAKLNPEIDVNSLVPGQLIKIPWNR